MRPQLALIAALTLAAMNAQTVDRTKPPETPPLPAFKLPAAAETRLPNGLAVVIVEDNRFPLVTVRLAFEAGSRFDPAELRGLSEGVASLITEGTRRRTSRQIAEEAASIGGSVAASSSADSLILAGSALAENTPKLLDLIADVARNATFPADEVQLHKENRKQRLLEQRSQPDFLAQEKLTDVVFGANSYSYTSPTLESIDKLDIPALTKFRDAYLVPNNAVLIVLGKLPPRAQLNKLLTERFGDWKQGQVPKLETAPIPAPKKSITLVDRPGSVQANVQIGHLGVTRAHSDYYAMVAGNTILGGGASSRLFNDIREKQGFAYNVYSHQMPMKDAALFAAGMQVRNDVVAPALTSLIGENDGPPARLSGEVHDAHPLRRARPDSGRGPEIYDARRIRDRRRGRRLEDRPRAGEVRQGRSSPAEVAREERAAWPRLSPRQP
jgi:zinc protease